MKPATKNVLFWLPRLFGAAIVLFFCLFAVGALIEHPVHALPHLLPAALIAAIVALGWKRDLVGAAGFGLCAVGYAVWARRLDWSAVISGPLLVASLLHLVSWRFALPGR